MIVLDRLTKCFGFPPRTALEGLSLRVDAGEVVALVGPNGAGKSTALRIVAGVVTSTRGTLSMVGPIRLSLGYLPQKLGVPLGTVVGDLVRLVAEVRAVPFTEGLEALARFGLRDRVGASLGQLSGGERQRVMLALATLGPVSALVLDEPSISLDVEGSEGVRHAILDAKRRGVAVLFASHHLNDVAALADRIVVMVDGRVAAQGTLDELAAAAGVSRAEVSGEAPIDRIYRVLVTRGRAGLKLVKEDAA